MPKKQSPNLAKDELFHLLKKDTQEWNRLRGEYPGYEPDLSGVNLRNADLGMTILHGFSNFFAMGMVIREGDMENDEPTLVPGKTAPVLAIEKGGSLSGANLSKANLHHANLSRCNLNGADLTDADLRGANLHESDLRANLSGADLRDANISDAVLSGTRVWEANLSSANLSGAKCLGTDFSRAILSKADLTKADMRDVIFADELGNSADLSFAILKGAKFSQENGESIQGGFLELSTVKNLATAIFDSPDFLTNYIERAFKYVHRDKLPEVSYYPKFGKVSLSRIRTLLLLFESDKPPDELIEIISLITDELIKYLAKHPEKVYEINPRQFEELIAELLASFGWQVQLTASTKDGGYDIYAINKDGTGLQSSWIIECKKYSPERKVGISFARALYGVKTDLRVSNAMLATTSSFTRGTKDFKAERYDFHLRDYQEILEWINEYRPNPKGKLYIKNNKLILPKRT